MKLKPMLAMIVMLGACDRTDYEINPFQDSMKGPTVDDSHLFDGDNHTDDTGIEETGAIGGRICDPDEENWVVGARVTAEMDLDGDGVVEILAEDITDVDGRFDLPDLPPANYVLRAEKGSFSVAHEMTLEGAWELELPEDICLDPHSVKIAVVDSFLDPMQNTLIQMGVIPDFYWHVDELLTPAGLLESYDMVFFGCGMDSRAFEEDAEDVAALGARVRSYVDEGGSIYVSDLAFPVMQSSFGETLAFEGFGNQGVVDADVRDLVMNQLVGPTARITYSWGGWAMVQPQPEAEGLSVLLEGVPPGDGYSVEPLAVTVDPGTAEGGQAIYTTFHTHANATEGSEMYAILKEMVYAL